MAYGFPIVGASIQALEVETGVFGAAMEVALVNDGPATFILELPAARELTADG